MDYLEILEQMKYSTLTETKTRYKSFYSSELGGIITLNTFMLVHADDYLFIRGHVVSDVIAIEQGNLYLFENHFKRLLQSAAVFQIPLPFPISKVRSVILDTCAKSNTYCGKVRVLLSAGRVYETEKESRSKGSSLLYTGY